MLQFDCHLLSIEASWIDNRHLWQRCKLGMFIKLIFLSSFSIFIASSFFGASLWFPASRQTKSLYRRIFNDPKTIGKIKLLFILSIFPIHSLYIHRPPTEHERKRFCSFNIRYPLSLTLSLARCWGTVQGDYGWKYFSFEPLLKLFF